MKAIEELLFRLRFSQYRWNDADVAEIERLRPHVRSDERVRHVLMAVVLEAEYLSIPSRQCLTLLLDELPESVQVQYLLRSHAYDYRGEDAMGTLAARKLMCQRGLLEARLRREVEQTAFFSGQSIQLQSSEYVGKDLYRDFVMEKFWEWAAELPKYLPCVLGDVVLAYTSVESAAHLLQQHPDFPLADYDLGTHTHELECRLAAGSGRPSPVALIGALRQDGIPTRAIYEVQKHAPVESWSQGDFAFVEGIAADPGDPFHGFARSLIAQTADTSPLAKEWVQRQLNTSPVDQVLVQHLARKTQDPNIALRSLQLLADDHMGLVTILQTIERFAYLGKRLPADWAVPTLLRVYRGIHSDWKHQVLMALQRGYPDDPETRRLLTQTKTAAPDASASSDECERLLQVVITSSDYLGGQALAELSERFLDNPKVPALLFQKAAEAKATYAQQSALLEVAFRFPDAPETLDLLTRSTDNPWDAALQDTLISHRSGQHASFEQLRARMISGEWRTEKLSIAGLALWYGDRPGTFDLLSGYFETLVQRWPENERTFAVLRQSLLDSAEAHLTLSEGRSVEAARLLSRAFSHRPETPALLRACMNYRAAIFAEYLGLNLGKDEAMDWGVSVLRELNEDPTHTDLAKSGPKLLIHFFGPRKCLLDAFQTLQKDSPCSALRQAIDELLRQSFPRRVVP